MKSSHKNILFRILSAAVVSVVVSEIAVMIRYRETWVDEIFAGFKGYLILTGELVPFRNGIFDYAPLTAGWYGTLHYLGGPSLYAARALSSVFFGAALMLIFLTGRKLAGRWAGLGAIALTTSDLLLVGNYVSATMYAWTLLCLVFVVWAEAGEWSRRKKTAACAIALIAAVLGRTNMIAAVLIYLVYLAALGVRPRRIALTGALIAAGVCIGYAPLILPNPAVAVSFLLGPYAGFGLFGSLPRPAVAQSLQSFLTTLTEFFREYYGYAALFSVVVGGWIWRIRRRIRAAVCEEPAYALAVMLSLGLFAAHFCYWRVAGNLYYANYFIPLAAIAGAVGALKISRERGVAAVLLCIVIALNLAANAYRTDVVSSPRDESDLHRIARGADFVRAHTAPGDTILTFDNSLYHIFLADRRTFIPLMQRNFLFLPDADTEKVRRLGFYNFAILKEWIARDADYVLIHKERWPSSLIRSPFWGYGSEDIDAGMREIDDILRTRYRLDGEALNVYPRKYTQGNDGGTLELYRRIK
jgi:hypothetical protein